MLGKPKLPDDMGASLGKTYADKGRVVCADGLGT